MPHQVVLAGAVGSAAAIAATVIDRVYALLRTKLSDTTTVFNVGRSVDIIVRANGCLRLSRREYIYDSEMIPNAIIYPI
jgi:3-phenylpropionate/cinnamic acid dioxygenase small subunit